MLTNLMQKSPALCKSEVASTGRVPYIYVRTLSQRATGNKICFHGVTCSDRGPRSILFTRGCHPPHYHSAPLARPRVASRRRRSLT